MSDDVATRGTLRADVAEEVRALLGRRRMSSVALARGIGKSHTYVWRRLSGETAFDLDDIEAIARILSVRLVELLPAAERRREGVTYQYQTPLEPTPITTARRPEPAARRPRDNRPSGRPTSDRPQFRRPVPAA
jgi:transcriptional regulator with XRE-family HTH domain